MRHLRLDDGLQLSLGSWDKFYGKAADDAAFPIFNKIMSFGSEHTFTNIQSIFSDNKIWLSRRSDFNDPFDIDPVINVDIKRRHYRSRLRAISALDLGSIPDSEFSRIANLRNREKTPIGRQLKIVLDNSFRVALNQTLDETGIYCLSGVWDSQLLWAHYGSGHTGVCIRYRITGEDFNFILEPVRYVEARQKINASSFWTGDALKPFDPQWDAHYRPIFFNKHYDWKYECEYRIMKIEASRSYLKLVGIEPFSVLFGCRASESDIAKTLDILRHSPRRPDVYQLRVSADEYDFSRRMLRIRY